MVSTRGLRYKFSEGERVLCYEPDPTKAKVLYDSKVLEVVESKDKRGRRTVEYLIHFQGWNSSWDRCVSEDFVLKDTEENRQLQKDLAEKSQLQLGAYLYRRERKKGGVSGGAAKRPRHGFSDDSSSSTQPEGGFSNSNEEGEPEDTDSSSGSNSSQPLSPPNPLSGPASITLPSALRDRLTFDYHLVVKRGRLLQLPATPSAAEVLESFVKWFARAGAWHTGPRPRHEPAPRPDLLDVSCRLNLVREVADGLRVYFDFILRSHLLYKQEVNQYSEVCGQFVEDGDEVEVKCEPEECQQSQEDSNLAAAEEDLKSPKIPEYSHLPPDPTLDDNHDESESNPKSETQETSQTNDGDSEPRSIKSEPCDKVAESSELNEDTTSNGASKETRTVTRSGAMARRLRSHKSAVSEPEDPAPCASAFEPRTFETMSSSVGSSGSSLSSGWSRSAPTPAPTNRTPLSHLLDKVAKWQIIPREGTEHLPCRVYGAIHLARLFVKLPEFLNSTQMSDFKLKLVLKHVDMFVQYLEDHSEWFGEMYYIADNASRSH